MAFSLAISAQLAAIAMPLTTAKRPLRARHSDTKAALWHPLQALTASSRASARRQSLRILRDLECVAREPGPNLPHESRIDGSRLSPGSSPGFKWEGRTRDELRAAKVPADPPGGDRPRRQQ